MSLSKGKDIGGSFLGGERNTYTQCALNEMGDVPSLQQATLKNNDRHQHGF